MVEIARNNEHLPNLVEITTNTMWKKKIRNHITLPQNCPKLVWKRKSEITSSSPETPCNSRGSKHGISWCFSPPPPKFAEAPMIWESTFETLLGDHLSIPPPSPPPPQPTPRGAPLWDLYAYNSPSTTPHPRPPPMNYRPLPLSDDMFYIYIYIYISTQVGIVRVQQLLLLLVVRLVLLSSSSSLLLLLFLFLFLFLL